MKKDKSNIEYRNRTDQLIFNRLLRLRGSKDMIRLQDLKRTILEEKEKEITEVISLRAGRNVADINNQILIEFATL